MTGRQPTNVPAGDLPWNDEPADTDVVPGTEEPAPAEVEGDEGDEEDVAYPRVRDVSDQYRRDTLDERLREEVPDRPSHLTDAAAGSVQAAIGGEDDLALDLGEPDSDDDLDDGLDAEEAAVHIRDQGDV